MKYRADIDGLRALSVIAVIIFHCDFNLLSGGYVGVDIFFIISGYLITGLVFDEVKSGTFTYAKFYKRRIARLLPALLITLFLVLLFGFLFYDNHAFDNLGKEIFFSAIGAANILFAQGINYFAQEDSVRPLIHLWSLGVEEQFYLIWPTCLIFLAFFRLKHILVIVTGLFFISFYLAVSSVDSYPIKTYFYPQYRAFELLLGAFTALTMRSQPFSMLKLNSFLAEIISSISVVLIISPMFLLDKNSTFPGLNTLYSCIGATLFIVFSSRTMVARLLSFSPLVTIGLISYPLYLFHQPILSFIQFFELTSNKLSKLAIVLIISIPLSWFTYRYIEQPIRKIAHKKNKSSKTQIISLSASLAIFAIAGLYVAKNNGVGERFKILNPFAYQVTEHSATTFHKHFIRGLNVSKGNHSKILFVGDSVLQQYVYPLSKALQIDKKEIDTVTRGGCVLLKGVEFLDTFSDISCNDLRDTLYKQKKHYEYVVISQSWGLYDNKILNTHKTDPHAPLKKWIPFIDETIKHFKAITNNIIIIASHLQVEGTLKLNPTLFLSKNTYLSELTHLKVSNVDALAKSYSFFKPWQQQANVMIIHPKDIWSETEGEFTLHDENWSFFSDSQHASNASTKFIVKQLKMTLMPKQTTSQNQVIKTSVLF